MPHQDSRILVVEDEELNRTLLVKLLQKEGFSKISTAENGLLALEMIRQTDFDAILLDISMPEMDGYDLLEQLHADMHLREIPVIMISGVDDSESTIRCIELGATDYLHKPIDPLLLRARLGSCLERKYLQNRQETYIAQMKAEKKRSDQLLNVILPSSVASELKSIGHIPPRRYDNTALLFCDISGFTAYCDKHSPDEVISSLQLLFGEFEEATRRHGLEKIKTIGDAFMSAAGLTVPHDEPLLAAIACGLDMIASTRNLDQSWDIRVGINQGSVVAGIVGKDRYQFDVWGDAVNVASRMADIASKNSIALPLDAWLSIKNQCSGKSRGILEIKGKGKLEVVEVSGLLT